MAHLTYHVVLKGHSGVADVWAQADASGAPVRAAQTLTMSTPGKNSATSSTLSSRYVQEGQQAYLYDPGHNANFLAPDAREDPSWILPPDTFFGVNVAQELNALALQSPQRVQLLPPRMLDVHLVDAIEVDGWFNQPELRTTFYFDTVLRSTSQPKWQACLATEDTMTEALPQAFMLNAPATARLLAPDPDLTWSTFITVCHTTARAKVLLQLGKSPIAVCQMSVPSMTAASLVVALVKPDRAVLHAAVTVGQITPAQEAESLAALQARLSAWITSPGGIAK
jgi:hypothetical protein